MRKLVFVLVATLFTCSGLFAADGATIFKRCAVCHGQKAEKSYLNKVPILTTVDEAQRVSLMKQYKAGSINGGKGKFGLGAIMRGQMASLSEEDMTAVSKYISTLK